MPPSDEGGVERKRDRGREKMITYKKENIPLAKNLRKNMTPWERKLWYMFLKNYPVRFQRQKAIGNYIADFYCAKAKLIIELDGEGHYKTEKIKQDKERTENLEKYGIKVIRILNSDVDKNFEGVCDFIDLNVKISPLPQGGTNPVYKF